MCFGWFQVSEIDQNIPAILLIPFPTSDVKTIGNLEYRGTGPDFYQYLLVNGYDRNMLNIWDNNWSVPFWCSFRTRQINEINNTNKINRINNRLIDLCKLQWNQKLCAVTYRQISPQRKVVLIWGFQHWAQNYNILSSYGDTQTKPTAQSFWFHCRVQINTD